MKKKIVSSGKTLEIHPCENKQHLKIQTSSIQKSPKWNCHALMMLVYKTLSIKDTAGSSQLRIY